MLRRSLLQSKPILLGKRVVVVSMRQSLIFPSALALSILLHLLLLAGVVWGINYSFRAAAQSGIIEVLIVSETEFKQQKVADAAQKSETVPNSVSKSETLSLHSENFKKIESAKTKAVNNHPNNQTNELSAQQNTVDYALNDAAADNKVQGPALGAGGSLRLLSAPKPPYPFAARLAGFEGKLTLELLVANDGSVKSAEIVESSGRSDCDSSALETVKNHWHFSPYAKPNLSKELVVVRYSLK